MLKFKTYINEAKVSAERIDRTLSVFIRYLEKKSGNTYHRYGGSTGTIQIKNGTGYLFITKRKTAICFNYVKGVVTSLSVWNSFKLGKKADYNIDLGGLTLMQAAKKIIGVIVKPKTGVIRMTPDPTIKESTDLLSEATRVKPEDFFNIVSKSLKAGQQISTLTWDEISDIAAANDKQVPGVVRTLRSGKGRHARYDLTKLVMASPKQAKMDNAKDYFIKITAQDTVTKSFVSVKGDKTAASMLDNVRKHITNPDVAVEMKDPNSLFGIMKNLVQLVCRKSRNALLIYGGPGIGKTYTVLETLKQENKRKNKDWFFIKGKITTASLYQNLFMHRKGSILVFDDTDSVWGDQDSANILKAALDSYDERLISWYSNRTINVSKMDDDEKEDLNDNIDLKLKGGENNVKLPSEFIFNGRIIFISNLPKNKFDSAVLTRSAKIDMTLTDEQIFVRMNGILEHLGDKKVDLNIKKEILDFLHKKNKSGLLDGPSMRTFVAAEDLYKSGLDNWKDLLDYV